MIALKSLVPLNFLEEKVKFLADTSYNPQFMYAEPIDQSALTEHGVPQKEYLELSQAILEKAYHSQTEEDLVATEGPKLTQQEVTDKANQFLSMHGLEKRFQVVWSNSFVSRASATSNALKLRLPVDFRREGLLGMLYHEIGTHALRRINYEQQPWFKKKKKYGFSDYLRTEEGLAVLHSLIPHTEKLAFNPAIRYFAVAAAASMTFSELWHFLKKYIDDRERRWMVTFRQKRGLTDTRQPGGYTKDLVYFEGMVSTWSYLKEHSFDCAPLYYGKLDVSDVEKARALNPNYSLSLPSFYVVDPDQYAKEIQLIGAANMLK